MGQIEVQLGQLGVQLGQLQVHLGQFDVQLEQLEAELWQVEVQHGQLEVHVGQPEVHLGKLEVQLGQLEAQRGQLEVQLGQLEAHVEFVDLVQAASWPQDTRRLEIMSPAPKACELLQTLKQSKLGCPKPIEYALNHLDQHEVTAANLTNMLPGDIMNKLQGAFRSKLDADKKKNFADLDKTVKAERIAQNVQDPKSGDNTGYNKLVLRLRLRRWLLSLRWWLMNLMLMLKLSRFISIVLIRTILRLLSRKVRSFSESHVCIFAACSSQDKAQILNVSVEPVKGNDDQLLLIRNKAAQARNSMLS